MCCHVLNVMTQLNLFKYFKASLSLPQVALSSPDGPLSREVPSIAISLANKEVEEVMASSDAHITKKEEAHTKTKVHTKTEGYNRKLI